MISQSRTKPFNTFSVSTTPKNLQPIYLSATLDLFHWNTDHYRSHDIIDLEVPFGALRMGIMAADATLGHSKIRIDGLEVTGVCGGACPAAPQTGTGAKKKGASPQQYGEGPSGEPARRQACRSGV